MSSQSTLLPFEPWLIPRYLVPGQEEDDGYDDRDSKKRKRGQNQNRKRPVVRESINLCPAYARGEQCPYGDTYYPQLYLLVTVAANFRIPWRST